MTVMGRGSDARVVVALTNEEGVETAVKAVFSDTLMRTPQGLMLSDNLIRDPPSGPGYLPNNECLHS